MAEDHEVLRQVWDGRVPVSFVLASNEIGSVEQPDRLFMLVSRVTYFPLIIDHVQRYFQRYATTEKSSSVGDVWLEDDNGLPVQWHYPVGVLYDLAAQPSLASGPWPLTVHFHNFPEHALIRLSCRDAVEAIFMSAVKEADCLKHRGQVILMQVACNNVTNQNMDHLRLFEPHKLPFNFSLVCDYCWFGSSK